MCSPQREYLETDVNNLLVTAKIITDLLMSVIDAHQATLQSLLNYFSGHRPLSNWNIGWNIGSPNWNILFTHLVNNYRKNNYYTSR